MVKLPFPFVLYYDIATRQISIPGLVQLVDNLNQVAIHNAGNTIVLVNDDPLQPGESKSWGGNWGEIFTGRVFLQFVMPVPAPPIPNNAAFVTQKFYQAAKFLQADDLSPILGLS